MTDKKVEESGSLSVLECVMEVIDEIQLDYSVHNEDDHALITVDVPENDDKTYNVAFLNDFLSQNAHLESLSKPTRSLPMKASFRCAR